MTTYLGKSCSFCLPGVPFVNCRQFMYLVISLLVWRAGYGIWLYQFLIIAYLFTSWISALAVLILCRRDWMWPFPVWCLGQDVEFDCSHSDHCHFIYIAQYLIFVKWFVFLYHYVVKTLQMHVKRFTLSGHKVRNWPTGAIVQIFFDIEKSYANDCKSLRILQQGLTDKAWKIESFPLTCWKRRISR